MLDKLRVIELRTANVKRIKTFSLSVDPAGGLVIIGGNNGEGKTSAIDSLFWALGGTMAVQDVPIREGEDSASTRVVLAGPDGEPQLIVTRRYTAKGSSLKVTSPEGVPAASPQGVLNQLFSTRSFDPLAFTRMSATDQRTALLAVVDLGIDLAQWEIEHDGLALDRRTARRLKGLAEARLGALTEPPEGTPDVAPDASAVSDRIADAMATNRRKQALDIEAAGAAQAVLDAQSAAVGLEATAERIVAARVIALRDAERELAEAQKRMVEVKHTGEAAVSAAGKAATQAADAASAVEPVAVDDLQAELRAISEVGDAVRVKQAHQAGVAEVAAAIEAVSVAEAKMDQSTDVRAHALGRATMPVEGLGIHTENYVTLHGLPFDQASSAEQLAVSARIAMAMHPRLRIMRINDGSLLDNTSMLALAELATAEDYQVFIERVGKGDPGAVIFENGVIEEAG